MAVNIKMGVDIGNFTAGIKEGQQILKGLNAEMKASEAEFKATGNAEQKMSSQTKTLNSQLNVQKGIADQAKQALEAMTNAGVKPTDAAYQKLYVTMMNAEAGMNEAQAALNSMGEGAAEAAGGVDKLQSGLNGISKKISLDQVISGIGKITSGLENAAKKAISLGESIFDNVMDAAKWADDSATMAMMYGIDLDQFLKIQKLVQNGMDTSVDAILKSQSKLKKGIGDDSKATLDALKELGVGMRSGNILDPYSWQTKNPTEMFWEAGKALMALGDEYEQEAKAQALFGKSWKELIPLFDKYSSQTEFQTALDSLDVESTDTVNNLATLNDKMGEFRGNLDTIGREIIGQLAPGLISVSDSLNGLLSEVLKYLKSEDGKAMLESMKDSFLGLFDGLKDISAESVVSGFKNVFESVVGGFKWIKDNGNTLLGILEGIGIFWAGLKVSEGALTLLKLVNGLQGLLAAGGGAAGAAGAAGAGGGAGAGFSAAILAGVKNAWVTAGGMSALAPLGVFGAATLPAEIVMNQTRQKWAADYNRRMTAAELPDNNAWFISQAAETLGLSGQVKWENAESLLMGLSGRKNQQLAELYNILKDANPTAGNNTWNLLNSFWNGAELDPNQINEMLQNITDAFADNANKKVSIPSELTLPDNQAALLAESVGTVMIHGQIVPDGVDGSHANGIWAVPYDGYLARLHKNERVIPARQMTSRNFTSNMYIENMNMNGGIDADGLAARVAAENRRIMSGYGSN